jgi:hypothetical protein
LLAVLQPATAAREMSVLSPEDSAALSARRLSVERSRANGKATSRLKKTPRKPRKPIAKKSVRLARTS